MELKEEREITLHFFIDNAPQVWEAAQKKQRDCFNVNPAIQEVDGTD